MSRVNFRRDCNEHDDRKMSEASDQARVARATRRRGRSSVATPVVWRCRLPPTAAARGPTWSLPVLRQAAQQGVITWSRGSRPPPQAHRAGNPAGRVFPSSLGYGPNYCHAARRSPGHPLAAAAYSAAAFHCTSFAGLAGKATTCSASACCSFPAARNEDYRHRAFAVDLLVRRQPKSRLGPSACLWIRRLHRTGTQPIGARQE